MDGLRELKDLVSAFFAEHRDFEIVFHNAPFDLDVIHTLAPDLDFYKQVTKKLIWDTQLLHRLYVLAREGHTAGGPGQSTLDHCTKTYLGLEFPKDTEDGNDDEIRPEDVPKRERTSDENCISQHGFTPPEPVE